MLSQFDRRSLNSDSKAFKFSLWELDEVVDNFVVVEPDVNVEVKVVEVTNLVEDNAVSADEERGTVDEDLSVDLNIEDAVVVKSADDNSLVVLAIRVSEV